MNIEGSQPVRRQAETRNCNTLLIGVLVSPSLPPLFFLFKAVPLLCCRSLHCRYKNFFPHALHDAVMLTADAVLQLECIHKSEQNTSVAFKSILTVPYFTDDSLLVFRYGSTKRLARFFPDVTADWVALGGSEVSACSAQFQLACCSCDHGF